MALPSSHTVADVLEGVRLRRHALFAPGSARVLARDAPRFVPGVVVRPPPERHWLRIDAGTWARPGVPDPGVRAWGHALVLIEGVRLSASGQWGPLCCVLFKAASGASRDAFVAAMRRPEMWGERAPASVPVQCLAGPVVTTWPWHRSGAVRVEVSGAEAEAAQQGTVIVQGELMGAGPVVVKLMPEPDPPAADECGSPVRELRAVRLATHAAHSTGLPHVAEHLHSLCLPDAVSRGTALFGAGREDEDGGRTVDRWAYRVALVLRRVSAPCAPLSSVLDVLAEAGAPPERTRAVVRSLIAQYASACVVLGDYGIAQVDNHPGNLLLEWVDHDWSYALQHPTVCGTVPVVGLCLRIIDWDLSLCVPFPSADEDAATGRAVCVLAGEDADPACERFDALCRAWPDSRESPAMRAGILSPRWNPGEDWARFGLMLRDTRWFPAELWRDHIGDELGAKLFGATVAGTAPGAVGLATQARNPGVNYSFLVQGDDVMSRSEPVALPDMRHPGEALAALLEDQQGVPLPLRRVVRSLATERAWTRQRALLGGPGRRFNVRPLRAASPARAPASPS